MVRTPQYPLFLLRTYLALPFVWPLFGKQFLIVSVVGENGFGQEPHSAKP
jgi:hypothetical protein